ncbi:hypothetical protein [Flavobacterium sp. MDT1-60]|uniref:hypothetical protein n=1 Tax=Flavobacterium sp. MDT1-60 TaxID=1979344 RepID=UPI0017816755|nr:hypothetical protein [Flavobacterium sp. MDT1-60]QOG02372.1 hypothetical protein IHE43_21750 [Flavobacterium sp. MDT1-60]
MKKTLLFIFLLMSAFSIAQTIPFKFKNARDEKNIIQPDLKAFRKYKDSLRDKGEKLIQNDTVKDYYKILKNKFETLAKQKEKEIDELYEHERTKLLDSLEKNDFNEKELLKIRTQLEGLDDEMYAAKKIVRNLIEASEEMEYKSRNLEKFKRFPVRFNSSVDAQLYYDYYAKDKKTQFLKNSVISFSSDGGNASIYNELFADYFGGVRVGIGALVSNKPTVKKDSVGIPIIDSVSIQKDAVQRLLGGGGNISINGSYPLLGYENNNNSFAFKLILPLKLSCDVPILGTENKDYSINYDAGLEGSIFYTGILDILTFYTNFKGSIIGGNDMFYKYLNKESKPFFFGQLSAGIAFNSTFRISWNYYYGDSFVNKNFPATISFTIIPN